MIRRRDLAIALTAFMPAAAQTGATVATPPIDLMAEAREQWKQSGDQLRKVKVPIGTEPSFVFRP
jgi:hypothetical protein